MKNITIYFDMDGTIANLYEVEGWLPMLQSHNPTPYEIAKPMLNLSHLARLLNKIQKEGYKIGIISWLSKSTNDEYNEQVTNAKKVWLENHLPSVHWNEINIVAHGTPKEQFSNGNDILFDDELKNRENWKGYAYNETEIIKVLKYDLPKLD